MGRKGVSKRKAKKSRPFSSGDNTGSSNGRSGERSPVQSLVKDKGALLNNRGGMNPSAGSHKTQKKR